MVAKALAEPRFLSAKKVEQIGDSDFPSQPMLVVHCLCLTIVSHTLELEFLLFILEIITLNVSAGYLRLKPTDP